VRDRITELYGQSASIVHPPVDVDRFQPRTERGDYYVSLAALVPYKRVDLVIQAFNTLDRKLIVVGTGPELPHLRRIAKRNIEFTGWLSDHAIAELLSSCRGLVFAGVEDFGIALVEALAAGAPVIARAAGGALEIVVDAPDVGTGVLFEQPSTEAIVRAVLDAEQRSFVPAQLRLDSLRFHPDRFRAAVRAEVDAVMAGQLAAV
jgi:glycosyltransferase involved in cell wall biosynthesis